MSWSVANNKNNTTNNHHNQQQNAKSCSSSSIIVRQNGSASSTTTISSSTSNSFSFAGSHICDEDKNDDHTHTDTVPSSSSFSSSTCSKSLMALMITTNSAAGPAAGRVTAPAAAAGLIVVPAASASASASSAVRRRHRRPLQIPRAMLKHSRCSYVKSKSGRASTNFSPCSSTLQRLLMPALVLLCLIHLPQIAHAAPTVRNSRTPSTVHVPIGAGFTLDVGEGRTDSPADGFPGWARLNDSANQVYGIPQANDAGVYTIPLRGGERSVRIEVGNELKQRCEKEIKTIWLEIVDQQRIDELSMESQFNSVKSLLAKLNVRLADMRLFPFNYLDTYRTVTEIMHELEQSQQHNQPPTKIHGQQIVYTVNISCGELNEQSSEVISAAIENGLSFQVVQGILVKLHQPEATPQAPITNEEVDYNQQTDNGKNAVESGGNASSSSSPASTVPLIILALILAVLVLVSIFWILIKRAKAGQEKQTDHANGKAVHLPSPAGDSTTPMLDMRGNAERTTSPDTVGMAPENGTAGRN
ncbi:hypothetical protein niasHS_015731 [Heterodera schachtii]|uniref:Uncharacterized protein n=1 Tax=Heterodera schachtii TaxID=97005 RepID=A0ABD2I1G5_HETSC